MSSPISSVFLVYTEDCYGGKETWRKVLFSLTDAQTHAKWVVADSKSGSEIFIQEFKTDGTHLHHTVE